MAGLLVFNLSYIFLLYCIILYIHINYLYIYDIWQNIFFTTYLLYILQLPEIMFVVPVGN